MANTIAENSITILFTAEAAKSYLYKVVLIIEHVEGEGPGLLLRALGPVEMCRVWRGDAVPDTLRHEARLLGEASRHWACASARSSSRAGSAGTIFAGRRWKGDRAT
jgi:hypothetical protein